MEIRYPLGHAFPGRLTLAVRELLEAEDYFIPLGTLLVSWEAQEHPSGRTAGFTGGSGCPTVSIYPALVARSGQTRPGRTVADTLARTPEQWAALVVQHEVGHFRLWQRYPLRGEWERRAGDLPAVSAYAEKSPSERFAEAYVLWRQEPALLADRHGRHAERVLRELLAL